MYCKSFLLKVLYKTLFSECFCQKNVTNQKYEEKSDSCVADGGRGGRGTVSVLGLIIDKLYTQIGNVNRLHNIIEPFAALFWALGIVLAHILQ